MVCILCILFMQMYLCKCLKYPWRNSHRQTIHVHIVDPLWVRVVESIAKWIVFPSFINYYVFATSLIVSDDLLLYNSWSSTDSQDINLLREKLFISYRLPVEASISLPNSTFFHLYTYTHAHRTHIDFLFLFVQSDNCLILLIFRMNPFYNHCFYEEKRKTTGEIGSIEFTNSLFFG